MTVNDELMLALEEVGRLVEETLWDERHKAVLEFLDKKGMEPGSYEAMIFLVGLFVEAHEYTLLKEYVKELEDRIARAKSYAPSYIYAILEGDGDDE